MWGGLTTASELRRIADVADKYQVPTIKVTGGQRIDLLGIRKEDLIGVWKDLGMPSGHAYGKSIRTVKTCVGAEHCRFGTQLAMDMGVKLEKMLFDMYSPHKVKLAVSGCPRNCAEAGIKDVGVIGVDSGYELYVGGNGGIKTEVAQFFVKVKSDEEVHGVQPAPSCSSTARKASTSSAPATTSNASASTTPRAWSSRTKKTARRCTDACWPS
jgi:nitrite reductase (NADH) large subunit